MNNQLDLFDRITANNTKHQPNINDILCIDGIKYITKRSDDICLGCDYQKLSNKENCSDIICMSWQRDDCEDIVLVNELT